ncbi:PaaI family thioesterase [Caballeronia sp. LjRoot34]|uniref:PaaI family thioesterase n=1 Tax=Caballeronia sp. LjRoot34 TaxID=3342325 RepID=UPI003ECD9CB1
MSTDITPEIDSEHEAADWVVPAGFCPVPSEGFLDTVGPVYMREDDAGGLCIASQMLERHRNQGGNVHGGMLATLADYAIGFNLLQIGERPTRFGTVSLNIDFVSNGRIGEWLEATVTTDKAAGRVRFASCVIRGDGGRLVVRASGVFSASTLE